MLNRIPSLALTRQRLHFIDGMRALAALYVVLNHHVQDTMDRLPQDVFLRVKWLHHGHLAVDVFIVLSGFCLMKPVICQKTMVRGGNLEYFYRRARRILPPYYAALLFSIAVPWLIVLVSWLACRCHAGWPAPVSPPILFSHLFLVHNLSPKWVYAINAPLWSIAVESQIYVLFPLLLLPIWKRFGCVVMILAGYVIGMIPHFALGPGRNLDWSYPWYLGLFGCGMTAGVAVFTMEERWIRIRRSPVWGSLAISLISAVILVITLNLAIYTRTYATDCLVGIAVTALIVWGSQASLSTSRHPVMRVLESRILARIGLFSYSLYLIHVPVSALLQPLCNSLQLMPISELMFRFFVETPVAIVVAYIFHLCFELKFMSPPIPRALPVEVTSDVVFVGASR